MGKCPKCGSKSASSWNLCTNCQEDRFKKQEAKIRRYFICCPLCASQDLKADLKFGFEGRDTLQCEACKAKWHLYMNFMGLSWAKLELVSKDKKGQHLLGKQLTNKEWQKMANEAQLLPPQKTSHTTNNTKESDSNLILKEKTIVREKEVIVKIRCNYCRNLYLETNDNCPYCGAKN
jgi:hypothetical protein